MKIVVGVDSGGSTTRALAVTLDGERVGYAERGGGNPSHDAAARENVRETIREVVGGHDAVHVVAGIAGYDRDDEWAQEATDVRGLRERTVVNDAVVAHFGAFGGAAGIVTIQGTGSTIFAQLENGQRVKNGDFFHYARAGAVWVGINGIHKLLTDAGAAQDEALRNAAFAIWEVASLEALRESLAGQMALEARERTRRYGEFARAVTASAAEERLHAMSVCYAASKEIATGVRLLGSMFESGTVRIAPIGACVRSAPLRSSLERWLAKARDKRYVLVEPAHPPVVGAALMALREEGVALNEEQKARLAFQ